MATDFEIKNYMELLSRVKEDNELPNMNATAFTGSDEEVIDEESGGTSRQSGKLDDLTSEKVKKEKVSK